uniref:MCM OB domain-containing protein n=1 Tax=Amorphochlora amoebiformis TaxID=1561963 RepID=A0A0H5BI27_9EUKA|nr:hypothetical protein [Amorphochlora amoebiformis]
MLNYKTIIAIRFLKFFKYNYQLKSLNNDNNIFKISIMQIYKKKFATIPINLRILFRFDSELYYITSYNPNIYPIIKRTLYCFIYNIVLQTKNIFSIEINNLKLGFYDIPLENIIINDKRNTLLKINGIILRISPILIGCEKIKHYCKHCNTNSIINIINITSLRQAKCLNVICNKAIKNYSIFSKNNIFNYQLIQVFIPKSSPNKTNDSKIINLIIKEDLIYTLNPFEKIEATGSCFELNLEKSSQLICHSHLLGYWNIFKLSIIYQKLTLFCHFAHVKNKRANNFFSNSNSYLITNKIFSIQIYLP